MDWVLETYFSVKCHCYKINVYKTSSIRLFFIFSAIFLAYLMTSSFQNGAAKRLLAKAKAKNEEKLCGLENLVIWIR